MHTLVISYLWFSAGHLDIQSLRWLSYSTERTLRFGQSAANHDYKNTTKDEQWEANLLYSFFSPHSYLFKWIIIYDYMCHFLHLRPALCIVVSAFPLILFLWCNAIFLPPCFKSCPQNPMNEEHICLDWLAAKWRMLCQLVDADNESSTFSIMWP